MVNETQPLIESSPFSREKLKHIHDIVTHPTNQKIFLDHYSRTKNAAHSVWLGGWAEKADLDAVFIGKEFLTQPAVQDTLYALQTMQIMAPSDVLAKLSEIASASLEDFIDIAPSEDNPGQFEFEINLRKAQIANRLGAVKKIKHTKFGIELELHDSLSALRMLGQHAGLFVSIVRDETWRSAAIRDIRAGSLTHDALMQAFGDKELVDDLFREAGVRKPTTLLAETKKP